MGQELVVPQDLGLEAGPEVVPDQGADPILAHGQGLDQEVNLVQDLAAVLEPALPVVQDLILAQDQDLSLHQDQSPDQDQGPSQDRDLGQNQVLGPGLAQGVVGPGNPGHVHLVVLGQVLGNAQGQDLRRRMDQIKEVQDLKVVKTCHSSILMKPSIYNFTVLISL